MSEFIGFEGDPEQGFYPAYEQLEGPEGPAGQTGRTGDKGQTGELGGSPVWEGVYDLEDLALTSDAIAAAPQFSKTVSPGTGAEETFQWAFFEIPTPGPPPVNPGLNPGDPGYDDVMPGYLAALAAWQARRPIDFIDDVELGLWIEAEPGQSTSVELGLHGPHGGVYLGPFNLIAPGTPGYPDGLRIGYDAIDEEGVALEHRLAWWGDELGDKFATGDMRRFNRLGQSRDDTGEWDDDFSPAGWAGPDREAVYQVPNQMQDVFAESAWSGVWDFQQVAGAPPPMAPDKWFLAVRLNGVFGVAAGKARIRLARLKLQRYRRRLKQVRQGFRRFEAIYDTDSSGELETGIGPGAVRGYANFLHNPNAAGVKPQMPVSIPAFDPAVHVTPGVVARWINWDGLVVANVDANTVLTSGPGGTPGYLWYYKFPRPIYALIEAGGSWSRFVPRTDGTLINSAPDIGSSLVLELVVGLAGNEYPALVLERDIIVIERASQRLDHKIGPKFALIQSVALRAWNFTTQIRDFRGRDDDQYWIQAVAPEGESTTGSPYTLPHFTHADAPYIRVQEIPGAENFRGGQPPESGIDDMAYRPNFAQVVLPYSGPR